MKNNKLFGTYDEFKAKYITKNSFFKTNKNKDSNIEKTGTMLNNNLQQFIKQFVLRREKDDFYMEINQEGSEYSEFCDEGKNNIYLFIYLFF